MTPVLVSSESWSWFPVEGSRLLWCPTLDIGMVVPLQGEAERIYDAAYYAHLAEREKSKVGIDLISSRVACASLTPFDRYVEVGPGAGGFGRWLKSAFNFVKYEAVDRNTPWPTPSKDALVVAWDSIEHMEALEPLRGWGGILLTVPVEDDESAWLKSRHYKPGEHIWYFTPNGLVRVMVRLGYRLSWFTRSEEMFGRREVCRALFLDPGVARDMLVEPS